MARRQTITCTNDDPINCRMYRSSGLNESSLQALLRDLLAVE